VGYRSVQIPIDHPMLPHKIWLTDTAPSGNGISSIPKFDVPISRVSLHIFLKQTHLTGLSDDDVLFLEEFSHPGPEPRVRDSFVLLLRHIVDEFGHLKLASTLIVLETCGEFRKQLFHPNTRERRILDLDVVRMKLQPNQKSEKSWRIVVENYYLDRGGDRDAIREPSSVEIALECPD
jgi:hypothetical protein